MWWSRVDTHVGLLRRESSAQATIAFPPIGLGVKRAGSKNCETWGARSAPRPAWKRYSNSVRVGHLSGHAQVRGEGGLLERKNEINLTQTS